jgi:dethiobiotin synthetase
MTGVASGGAAGRALTVVVVGTGTDVGKTHVSSCLLAHLAAEGVAAAAFKPVATGVDPACEDAEAHARALGAPVEPPAFAYKRPVSPHLAAREEGRPVELGPVVARVAALAQGREVVLVEGAGGLLSPLSDTLLNADLARALSPPGGTGRLVLVAADRLGVLHDVRACLEAAAARGLPAPVVVLSAPPRPDASTGSNAAELARVGLPAPAAVFPRATFDAAGSRAAAARLWAALRAQG